MDVRTGRRRVGTRGWVAAAATGCAALLAAALPAQAVTTGDDGGRPAGDPARPGSAAGGGDTGVQVLGTATPPRLLPDRHNTYQHQFTAGIDNQGWWSPQSRATDRNDNYLVGRAVFDGEAHYHHNFFSFRLGGVDRRVISAELLVQRYMGEGDRTETLGLFGVTTGARQLNHNRGRDAQTYHDLATGQRFATVRVPTDRPRGENLRIGLNDAAVSAINRHRGGWFSMGGALLSLSADQTRSEYLFGFSRGRGVQRLVLYTNPPGDGE